MTTNHKYSQQTQLLLNIENKMFYLYFENITQLQNMTF